MIRVRDRDRENVFSYIRSYYSVIIEVILRSMRLIEFVSVVFVAVRGVGIAFGTLLKASSPTLRTLE